MKIVSPILISKNTTLHSYENRSHLNTHSYTQSWKCKNKEMIYLTFFSQSTTATILYTIFIMAAYNSKGGNCLAATYKCIHQQLQSSKTGQHVNYYKSA